MSIRLGSKLPDQGGKRILSRNPSTPLNITRYTSSLQQILPYPRALCAIDNNDESCSASFCRAQDASQQNRHSADLRQRGGETYRTKIVGQDNSQVGGTLPSNRRRGFL